MRISKSFRDIGLSPIVEISERAKALAPDFEKKFNEPFVYFQRGEVGFDVPEYISKAFTEAVSVKKLTKYPKSGGEPWFKDAIIAHLAEKGVQGLARDNVVCTYGGQEGLQLSFCMFEGCKAAGFSPIWSCMLENILPYSRVKLEQVPFLEDKGSLKVDFLRLEKALRHVDVLYLNTPHNPTGKVFSREEMGAINRMCMANDVVIVSDEAYKDIVFDGKRHVSMLEFEGDHIVSVFTFSKTFSATGLRSGYSVSRNKKLIDLMVRGNYTQTAGVVPAVQYALKTALEDKVEREKWISSYVDEMQQRRDIIFDGMAGAVEGLYRPEGAFYFFLDFNPYIPEGVEGKDKFLLERLLENGIAVVPGAAFGKAFEGYARLSFSTLNSKTVQMGIDRLKKVINSF